MRNLFISTILLVCVAMLAGVWISGSFLYSAPGSVDDKVVFDITPGSSFRAVAHNLEQQGLISNALYFRIYARALGEDQQVRRGEYALHKGMTPAQILTEIVSGKSIAYPLTIPEGWNMYEIGTLIESKKLATREEFLRLVRDPAFVKSVLGDDLPSLEGYLFPETYFYTKYTTLKEIVVKMVENFKANYEQVVTQEKPMMTRHELVTLASVIEKETGVPQERPMISSIFHNRLKIRMKLQSDPTIIYGMLNATGILPINITKADILRPSPYNTYTVAALPIGPIGNPGKESMLAALKPAVSEFLFFVSRNDGTHVFSKTYGEHDGNVKKFQLNPKAREGKSWRNLKKTKKPAAKTK